MNRISRERPVWRWIVAVATVALVLGVVTAASAKTKHARSQRVQKVTLALSPFQDVYSLYIGIDKGWYRKAGIDLKISAAPWDSAQQLMAGGQVNIANSTDEDVVKAAAQKRDVVFALPLYVIQNVVLVRGSENYKLYGDVRKTMSRNAAITAVMQQLKGKGVCLPVGGSQAGAFLRYAQIAGMDPKADFKTTYLPVEAALAAFLSGSGCDAFMGGIPQNIAALKRGAQIIVPGTALPTTIGEAGFSMSRAFADSHWQLLLTMQKIFYRQLQYIKKNPNDGFGIIARHLKQAGTPLAVTDLKVLWNKLELFPSSARETWKAWMCPSSDLYWKARWKGLVTDLVSTKVISAAPANWPKLFYGARVLKALVPVGQRSCG